MDDPPLCGLTQRWSRLWPGWHLEFHQDRYQRYPVAVPDPDVARGRRDLASRFAAVWPSERACTGYVNTVNAAHGSSFHLPEDERREARRRSRQAAEAAMEAATAEFNAIAADIAPASPELAIRPMCSSPSSRRTGPEPPAPSASSAHILEAPSEQRAN